MWEGEGTRCYLALDSRPVAAGANLTPGLHSSSSLRATLGLSNNFPFLIRLSSGVISLT